LPIHDREKADIECRGVNQESRTERWAADAIASVLATMIT
jgi:hypothetical protein